VVASGKEQHVTVSTAGSYLSLTSHEGVRWPELRSRLSVVLKKGKE